MPRKARNQKQVETLTHGDASRKNIPTAEYQAVMAADDHSPIEVAYERRNRDLDPQLVWRGKDAQDWSDLVVQAPPLFIQEKVHPQVLIRDLMRTSGKWPAASGQEEGADHRSPDTGHQFDLFADFNGLPSADARTEFYQHDANWSNRMILGDSLQVMASLAEREGLRGKVQCIYLDPPYGIKFNSNFQWSTTSRDVRDGNAAHITREPEQVKAFRDTWRDGIHSYLTYLRDRLTVARDLLTESGSIFVQIGDENVHRVRAVMDDEVFGENNHVASIVFRKTTGKAGVSLDNTYDVVVWFAKCKEIAKVRELFFRRQVEADHNFRYDFTESGNLLPAGNQPHRIARMNPLTSQSVSTTTLFEFGHCGRIFRPGKGGWKTNFPGMERLNKASRLTFSGQTLGFVRPFEDYPYQTFNDIWDDTRQSGFGDEKVYVVQTETRVIQRCILMASGSGTTAYVAEQWGRRWITIDTSRVAGPFTVESLSPHRLLGVDENDELIDNVAEDKLGYGGKPDFAGMILEHLKTAGVQQAHKDDRITFAALKPWPGRHVCAEGRYVEGEGDAGAEKRAGIFIGPEFGTVSRPDLVEAVREAADAGFDVLIACAFNYDAHASEFNKLGRVPILKARMNADLHMAADLKNTGHGNLFVIFGEPDITVVSGRWLVTSKGRMVANYEHA